MNESKRPSDFDRLGDLLAELGAIRIPDSSARAGSGGEPVAGGDISRQVADIWPDTVGPEISANARPLRVNSGRLTVATSSASWAQTLQLMSDCILSELNALLGAEAISDIIFRHAGWEDDRPVKNSETKLAEPVSDLSDQQRSILKDLLESPLDADLKEKMAAAMLNSFSGETEDPGR